jgi:ABC-type branched-subunit amino acid transport system substrate-binding protein
MKGAGVRPDIGYAVSWDGAQLIVGALRKYGFNATSTQIRDYINGQRDYSGAFGLFDFATSPQRGLAEDGVIIGRWEPSQDRWIAASRPGGAPLK